jgi:N-acetylglutamate synthase-like GNAT family acetyltransferase
MSFWGQSPGPTWTDFFWSMFICTGSVHAFPIDRSKLEVPTGAYCHTLHQATERDAEKIATFLRKYFKITERTVCTLSAERIRKGITEEWCIIYSAGTRGEILGCIVSRPLGECRFFERHGEKIRSSSVKNTGFIDFFCILPSLHKSGLGSSLLKYVRYRTSQQGRFVHFFQKELTPLRVIPPIWSGRYIARSVETATNHLVEQIHADHKEWPHYDAIKNSNHIFAIGTCPEKFSQDTQLFKYTGNFFSFYVAITDAFSVEKATDHRMGEVLSCWFITGEGHNNPSLEEQEYAMEIILDSSGYKILLMDSTFPHDKKKAWKIDAPYYYYIYNLNPRQFFTVRPWFWF